MFVKLFFGPGLYSVALVANLVESLQQSPAPPVYESEKIKLYMITLQYEKEITYDSSVEANLSLYKVNLRTCIFIDIT